MDLLTRAFDGLREDVADACGVLAEDMGADAQGHGWVGVTETRRNDMYRDSGDQQSCRV